MSPVEPDVPPVGEEIHLPGPSLKPVLLALGLTLTIVGTTLTLALVVVGAVLSVWVIVRWIGEARSELDELPLDESSA